MRRWALPLLIVAASTQAGAALGRPPGFAVSVTTAVPTSPARVAFNATFGGALPGTLRSLALSLPAGFSLDPRATSRSCAGAALRAFACRGPSRIGAGSGRIAVQGRFLPRTEYAVDAALYVTPPRVRSDPAGLLLVLSERQSALRVALPGRVISSPHGKGISFRFAAVNSQLPRDYGLTVAQLGLSIGSTAYRSGLAHHLLTTPRTCPAASWPVALTVVSGRRTRTLRATAACRMGP